MAVTRIALSLLLLSALPAATQPFAFYGPPYDCGGVTSWHRCPPVKHVRHRYPAPQHQPEIVYVCKRVSP